MTHFILLGYIYIGVVALLMLEYFAYRKWFNYELFFKNADLIRQGRCCCCIPYGWLVLSGAAVAFVVNVVFVCIIAFDSQQQWGTNMTMLQVVLALQIAYYVLQLAYVPCLIRGKETKGNAVVVGTILLVCAVLQVISFFLAVAYAGTTASRYLNLVPALWTSIFDFVLYSGFAFDACSTFEMSQTNDPPFV